MARRKGQSAAFLKRMRKKYRLGEFSTRGRKKRAKKRKRRKATKWKPGDLGYPGTSRLENFYRDLGVPEVGYDNK